MKQTSFLPSVGIAIAIAFAAIPAFANPIVGSYTANTLPANDDGSTGSVALGFDFNYFGTTYTDLFVNNNGNVTFNNPLSTFTPFGLTSTLGVPIIAPFFADVDTRGAGSGLVTYEAKASGVGGHPTFGVEWPGVGYFSVQTNKLNTFELLIVSRSDIAVGDADIYFNYGSIQWETGGASGGNNGLGGSSAAAGFSNGTGNPGTNFEIPGSRVNGALIDGGPNQLITSSNTGVPGQWLFTVRNGVVDPGRLPEPSSLALMGIGLAGVFRARRSKSI